MTLKQYQRKRDFEGTPEPTGAEPDGRPGGALRFVIQKHDATRLHYDLRLEVDGVLKSWAVPKGPSMDPEDKRLAVKTEDHPLEYLDFEDVIPKGEYGGGPMMVWDWGTYTVPEAADVEAAERKMRAGAHNGKLTFTLHGEKAKGTFHLVRMSGKEKDQWLLFHKDDEFASDVGLPGEDDLSVKTGRTMAEIMREDGGSAGDSEASGKRYTIDLDSLDLKEARKGSMPRAVEPMLATLTEERFDRQGWLFEIKWDGFRAMAEIHRDGVRLYSRTQQNYEREFGLLVRELNRLDFRAVMDGEIVAIDEEGRSEFQYLQRWRRTGEGVLVYYVFDLLYLGGYDLRDLPLVRRKALLERVLPDLPHVKYSQHVEEEGIAFFRVAAERGLEGVIAKDGQSRYQQGARSHQWLKFKARQTLEAVIGGFTEPRGGRKTMGAIILGLYEDSEEEGDQVLTYIGHTGTGFSVEDLEYVRARLEPLRRDTSPFGHEPETNAPPTWVEPEVVCRVAFTSWTESGVLRQASFMGLVDDRDARTVTREQEMPVAEPKPKRRKAGKKVADDTVDADGREVPVTSLDKVYWPDAGITKGDMIDYYCDMADLIVPYLVDRPMTLVRFPSGIDGESFYQKDIDYAPDWIRTYTMPSKSKGEDVDYLLCQDAASLIWMANLGTIPLNPWLSRIEKLGEPDYLAIDLDPLDISFEEVVRVALVVHEILEAVELTHLVKTSGATGLHIFVPLGAQYTYKQAEQFGTLVGHLTHERLPKITSLVRSPRQRRGKVYLDMLQNRRGQTMTAPYSLRARPGAPVSTPLRWEEVTPDLDPRDHHLGSIQARVDELGDLWRPVLGPGIDMEVALDALTRLWEKGK